MLLSGPPLTEGGIRENYSFMAKKGENRVIINLACSECKNRDYTTTKNKKNDTQRLELKKYCPTCREHKVYREVR